MNRWAATEVDRPSDRRASPCQPESSGTDAGTGCLGRTTGWIDEFVQSVIGSMYIFFIIINIFILKIKLTVHPYLRAIP